MKILNCSWNNFIYNLDPLNKTKNYQQLGMTYNKGEEEVTHGKRDNNLKENSL